MTSRPSTTFSYLSAVAAAAMTAWGCGSEPIATTGTPVAAGPVELPRGDSAPLQPVTTGAGPTGLHRSALTVPATCAGTAVQMKVLVLSADGRETNLQTITDSLDYLGTPYDRWVLADHSLSLPPLVSPGNPCAGNYVGIMLTTDSLAYSPDGASWTSALSAAQWGALVDYETQFGVREVDWYTYPSTANGFAGPPTAITTPPPGHPATLTAAGRAVFYYLEAAPIDVQYAYTYLAAPDPASTANTVLLADADGYALAMVNADGGRQRLMLTFDNSAYLTHSIVLSPGLVHWVTGGLHLGRYRGRLVPQVDDLFIADELWDPNTLQTSSARTYRMTAKDLVAAARWQSRLPTDLSVRLAWAFNGAGAASSVGGTSPASDALTTAVWFYQGSFTFINHTYDHWNLDGADSPTVTPYTSESCGSGSLAALADCEFRRNSSVARRLWLSRYSTSAMVSPDVSGLANTDVLARLYSYGVRYMVSDTSKAGYGNNSPSAFGTSAYAPNTILFDAAYPSMMLIPRHPTNLFFNVSTPEEWTSEYSCLYATIDPGSRCYCNPTAPGWPRYDPAAYSDPTSACYLRNSLYWPLQGLCVGGCTYEFVLDRESDVLSRYLLKGDLDPLMFHAANVRLYPVGGKEGDASLLSDLLDATLSKYSRYYRYPLSSAPMQDLGLEMLNVLRVKQGTVSAALKTTAWGARTLTLTNSGSASASVPVTGLCSGSYTTVLGKCVGTVTLPAGRTVSVAVR